MTEVQAKTIEHMSISKPLQPRYDSEPEYDPDEPGPPPPHPQIGQQSSAGEEFEPEYDPSEPEFEGDDDLPTFPTTHEIILKDHTKVVSALALDPSGARVVSGSHDYDVKLWDFGGMDARCKPFKSWEPAGTYYVRTHPLSYRNLLLQLYERIQIHDLKYSNDGQKFLVISGTTQAKLYSRDGDEEYVPLSNLFTFWDKLT
jgi:WD40 repeat protein